MAETQIISSFPSDADMETEEGENLRITFEEYKKVSNMLILHMREFEEKSRGRIEKHAPPLSLVNWLARWLFITNPSLSKEYELSAHL